MQYVLDGPDIPNEVLYAQEDGRLVLFCGAGISVPAGLPTFANLVEGVRARFNTALDGSEQDEWNKRSYDRVLMLLERRFGRRTVRAKVREILTPPKGATLLTHKAILELGTDRSGRIRLVTTNFDCLFDRARPGVRSTAAPLLPVPKTHKWNHLVYLHGKLDETDPTGQDLVLASGDFGVAYLTEGWASRFVAELFSQYTVLFVGYRVDDPVMRYLTDAIDVERTANEQTFRLPYALGGFDPGEKAAVETEWWAKGIRAILYPTTNGHELLHETLKGWAGIWSGGLQSKMNIVIDLATQDPSILPEDAVSRFCWAITDTSGAMARKLAELRNRAHMGWLEVFEKRGLLVTPSEPPLDLRVPLIDTPGATWLAPLDPVRRALAVWIAANWDDRRTVEWAVRKGGRLHPELQQILRDTIRRPQ